MNWTEGNNWVHHLHLPPGTHEFKVWNIISLSCAATAFLRASLCEHHRVLALEKLCQKCSQLALLVGCQFTNTHPLSPSKSNRCHCPIPLSLALYLYSCPAYMQVYFCLQLLIARDDGSTHWEQGENRTVEVCILSTA